MKREINERTYTDSVCGMKVSRTTAADEHEYKGKTYYFCAGACREAFEAEPEKYIRLHHQHGVKPRE